VFLIFELSTSTSFCGGFPPYTWVSPLKYHVHGGILRLIMGLNDLI
jgi:hypothetical protein